MSAECRQTAGSLMLGVSHFQTSCLVPIPQNKCHRKEEECRIESGWKAKNWIFKVDFTTDAVGILTETASMTGTENNFNRDEQRPS